MQIFYTDFDDLFERFAIMTIDGEQTDIEAYNYCKEHTTPELSEKLKEWIKNNPMQQEVPDCYAKNKELEAYLQRNIALIPSKDKKPIIAYSKEPKKMITDSQTLQDWKQKGITEYGFIPSRNNLLILDLDRGDNHANKADGIANFINLVSNAVLSKKLNSFFSNFPANYPCYTQTPSGGIHLYFKASYITPDITRRFDNNALNDQNIELKYNTKVTAAGSIYNNKEYIMHGTLEKVPEITLELLDLLIKAKPNQQKTQYMHFEKLDGRKWNETPEGIIEKATKLYSCYANHDFIYKAAILFRNAGMDKAIAERYIMQTPQHLQRDNKADTKTAINSIYR